MPHPVYCANCGLHNPSDTVHCMGCNVTLYGRGALRYERVRDVGKSILRRLKQPIALLPPSKTENSFIPRERVSGDALILLVVHSLRSTGILLVLGLVMVVMHALAGVLVVAVYLFALAGVTYQTWKNYYFSADQHNFELHYGILQKKAVTIPFYQIQNIHISRTLLDQMLGLARIEVETAGRGNRSRHQFVGGSMSTAEACLIGLTAKRADEVRDLLLRRAAEMKKDETRL